MTLLYHPLFKADLNQAVEYYNAQIDGLGDELRDEAEETILRIARNPQFYGLAYANVRRARLHRFKWYAVRYQLQDDGSIYILSIIHGARHPETGKDRSGLF